MKHVGTQQSGKSVANLENVSGANLLHNGCFRVNQRAVFGTVSLSAGQYGHDRWKAGASGCTYTFAASGGVTTLTITAGSLQQVIEGTDLQSGTYVLSWGGTAQGKIGAGSFGASGVSAAVTGGANLTVEFGTGTLALAQIERGNVPTLFELRPIFIETSLCQRFFFRFVNTAVNTYYGGAVAAFSATRVFAVLNICPVQLRASPTVSGNNLLLYNNLFSLAATASAVAVYSGSGAAWTLDITVSGGLTAGSFYMPALITGRVDYSADL